MNPKKRFSIEMGPDPTRAYFWSAVNKRPSRLCPGCFLNRPKEIFFDIKGEKLKNLTFLGEIFQTQTQTIDGWPNPGQKYLTRTHDYPQVRNKESLACSIFDNFWENIALQKEDMYIESACRDISGVPVTAQIYFWKNCLFFRADGHPEL